MRAITIMAILFALASCGGRGENKADATATEPQGEFYEWVTKHTNTYDADNRLVKVVERGYPVFGGLELPFDKMRTYEYKYRKLSDGATERREYVFENYEARTLRETLVTSPFRRERYRGKEITAADYDIERFDTAGRLTASERRVKFMDGDSLYVNERYEYDTQGRRVKGAKITIDQYGKVGYEFETSYRGGTDEIVSETYRDLENGKTWTENYRYEFSGDTLIRKRYRANQLMSVKKSIPGYTVETEYTEYGDVESVDKIITDGDLRIEVSDLTANGGDRLDSICYRNDRPTRHTIDTRLGREVYTYEYDEHGNITLQRERHEGFKEPVQSHAPAH
jgi:hypothetical protein